MGIITKFPSQSKQSNMAPTAPITGNPVQTETTQVNPQPFYHAIRILADIPDNYIKLFHIERLTPYTAAIIICHSEFGGSTVFTATEKTIINFKYSDAATEHDLPLVKRVEIFEIGKFSITMTIHPDGTGTVSTYIWY